MGKLFLSNYNKEVRKLLPEDLKNNISKALRKKAKPDGMEDVDRLIDLRPPVAEMTLAQVISELGLNCENKLANSLLSYIRIYETEHRGVKV
jgi:predicted nucleotidyltransferase